MFVNSFACGTGGSSVSDNMNFQKTQKNSLTQNFI